MTDDDENEANTVKYNIARIVRLSSGNFALFSPFDNDDGIKLVHIGDWESLEPFVPTADECQTNVAGIRDAESMAAADLAQGRSLLTSLGLIKPTEPLKRRF